MHIHEVAFEVVNREGLAVNDEDVIQPVQLDGNITAPQPWETGVKDTVVALPAQVTPGPRAFPDPGGSTCGTTTSSSWKTTR